MGGRLVRLAGDRLPERFADAADRALLRDRAAAAGLRMHGDRIVEQLADGGVRALPLKGPRLTEAAHGDPGLRSSSDVDVLVAPDELGAAVRIVRGLGFDGPHDPVGRRGLPELHFLMTHPTLPAVELHWRVHWHEEAFSRDLLARATPGPDGVLAVPADDQAACLLAYYARDGFYGLRLAADIGGWWERDGARPDTARLDGHAQRYPELARTWTAAAMVAERHAGVPAAAWLSSPRTVDRRVAMATRLASPTQVGDPDQLAANIALVDGLLSPAGTHRRFVGRQLSFAPEGQRNRHRLKLALRCGLGLAQARRR